MDGPHVRPKEVEARLWQRYDRAREKMAEEIRRDLAVPRPERR